MSLKIISEKELPLLSRKRIKLWYEGEGSTPSREEMVKEVAKKLKISKDKIIIKHVYSQFGTSKVKLIVHVYEDKDKIKTYEHKSLIEKHNFKKEEVKQEG